MAAYLSSGFASTIDGRACAPEKGVELALTILDLPKHPDTTLSDCSRASSFVGPASPHVIRPADERMRAQFVSGAPRLLTYWHDPSPAQFWDLKTGRVLSRLNAGTPDCNSSMHYFARASFTADGARTLATWGSSASLWLNDSGKRIASLPSVITAAISPDGLLIVTSGFSHAPRLLPATTLGGLHAACAYVNSAHRSLPEQYRDLPGICDRLPRQ